MSNPPSYDEQVLLAYEGEIVGHTTYTALADAFTDPDVKAVCERVAQMEGLTRDRLEPLAIARNADLPAITARATARGKERAAGMAAQGWRKTMEDYQPQTPRSIARFETMETLAPADELAAVEHLTAHSRTFARVVEHCLADNAPAAARELDTFLATLA